MVTVINKISETKKVRPTLPASKLVFVVVYKTAVQITRNFSNLVLIAIDIILCQIEQIKKWNAKMY